MEKESRPIVICGPARSGTTAVSIMLNGHAEILIGREVPLERVPSLRVLLGEIAEYHHDHEWTAQRRVDVVRALWFAASRPTPHAKPHVRRWGMKTPWAEFDTNLWDALVEPRYVYVLRRGDRVFQSHIRLGWGSAESPERLIARYKASLRIAEKMQARGTAHIVQLDLAREPESRQRLARGLFAFIDEEIDAGVESFVAEWPTHPWSFPTSNGEDDALPDEWQELLAVDSEYQELMAAHGY